VILGAGFHSRASRFSHLPARWLEVDLPAPAAYKQEVLAKHGLESKAATRIQLDVITDDWVGALKDAGWNPAYSTIYILEGLIYYLTTEQAKALLESIPSVPGSRMIVTAVEQSLHTLIDNSRSSWKTNCDCFTRSRHLI